MIGRTNRKNRTDGGLSANGPFRGEADSQQTAIPSLQALLIGANTDG